jgi:hypothetical protein
MTPTTAHIDCSFPGGNTVVRRIADNTVGGLCKIPVSFFDMLEG